MPSDSLNIHQGRALTRQSLDKLRSFDFPTPSTAPSSSHDYPSTGQTVPFPGLKKPGEQRINTRNRRALSIPSSLSTPPSFSSRDYLSSGEALDSQSPGSVLQKPLPTDLEGVRKSLRDRFGLSTQASAGNSSSPTSLTTHPTIPSDKPSPDISRWRKEGDLSSDWEEVDSSEKERHTMHEAAQNFVEEERQREAEDEEKPCYIASTPTSSP
ncbi:hypothetical protein V8E55_009705 [Tylopilus felleus]